VVDDLATERLDLRRDEIESWVRSLDADIVVPLADRDELVGLLVGTRAIPLRDSERVVLDEAARALTVLALTREAERRAELVRELELAEAVRQTHVVGDVRDLGGNRVAVIYRPTVQVAGDLWNCVALPDDRLLVLVGDVAGRGLSAALVSAVVHGASQTAVGLLAARATPGAVLSLLHDTVASVDDGRHRVTAMVALVDRARRRVEWASAGHRGGYLLHRTGDAVELQALIALGTALGESERVIGTGERVLEAGDVIVLTSDGVVEARDAQGTAFGERRLQRTLRTLGRQGGDGLAQSLLDVVRNHVGDVPHEDDMLFVVISDPARS
jgi:serine phosphatase RsbU (regulator of sigma subunit)